MKTLLLTILSRLFTINFINETQKLILLAKKIAL